MMKKISILTVLALVAVSSCREYNYHKPQIPFSLDQNARLQLHAPQPQAAIRSFQAFPSSSTAHHQSPQTQFFGAQSSPLVNPLLQSSQSSYYSPSQQSFGGGNSFAYGPNVQSGFANKSPAIGLPNPIILSGRVGEYVSQSEAGQLDVYPHIQINGNPRPFPRVTTSCYPGGQCGNTTLAPGQPDQRLPFVIVAEHPQIQPISNKCRQLNELRNAATASYYRQQDPVPLRPRNRRLFPYTEKEIPKNPFN